MIFHVISEEGYIHVIHIKLYNILYNVHWTLYSDEITLLCCVGVQFRRGGAFSIMSRIKKKKKKILEMDLKA